MPPAGMSRRTASASRRAAAVAGSVARKPAGMASWAGTSRCPGSCSIVAPLWPDDPTPACPRQRVGARPSRSATVPHMSRMHFEVSIFRPPDEVWAYLSDWRHEFEWQPGWLEVVVTPEGLDRKSTRLNSSHANISYAVFFL